MDIQEPQERENSLCFFPPSFHQHAPRVSVLRQRCGGKFPGPHRHKHTTDWTNDMLPQSIFSSAAWPTVIGHNCRRLLKGWKTMGHLCDDTDQFTSTSPGLLMLFPAYYFNEETDKTHTDGILFPSCRKTEFNILRIDCKMKAFNALYSEYWVSFSTLLFG